MPWVFNKHKNNSDNKYTDDIVTHSYVAFHSSCQTDVAEGEKVWNKYDTALRWFCLSDSSIWVALAQGGKDFFKNKITPSTSQVTWLPPLRREIWKLAVLPTVLMEKNFPQMEGHFPSVREKRNEDRVVGVWSKSGLSRSECESVISE